MGSRPVETHVRIVGVLAGIDDVAEGVALHVLGPRTSHVEAEAPEEAASLRLGQALDGNAGDQQEAPPRLELVPPAGDRGPQGREREVFAAQLGQGSSALRRTDERGQQLVDLQGGKLHAPVRKIDEVPPSPGRRAPDGTRRRRLVGPRKVVAGLACVVEGLGHVVHLHPVSIRSAKQERRPVSGPPLFCA